jgi:hypothetical protein
MRTKNCESKSASKIMLSGTSRPGQSYPLKAAEVEAAGAIHRGRPVRSILQETKSGPALTQPILFWPSTWTCTQGHPDADRVIAERDQAAGLPGAQRRLVGRPGAGAQVEDCCTMHRGPLVAVGSGEVGVAAGWVAVGCPGGVVGVGGPVCPPAEVCRSALPSLGWPRPSVGPY